MKQKKIIVPAVSVGLFVSGRQAIASVIDFGVVAESLSLSATFAGNTVGNTVGGYTFGGLTFVGNGVINGNTVNNLLTQLLGPETGLTLAFSFPGAQSGNFSISGAGLTLNGNTVTVDENTVTADLTSCTYSIPGTLLGCVQGTQVQIDPFDPAGLLQTLESAHVVSVSAPPLHDGPLVVVDKTNTITLAMDPASGNTYIGEEIVTTDSISAAAIPEPSGWSLAALGSALLAWWRRRRR